MRARSRVWLPLLGVLFAIATMGVVFSPGAATTFAPGVESGSLDLVQVGDPASRVTQLLGAPLTTAVAMEPDAGGAVRDFWHYSRPRHTVSHWAMRCVVIDRASQRVVRVDSRSLYDWESLLSSVR